MDLLSLLENHRKRLENITDHSQLEDLIRELQRIKNEDLKDFINANNINDVNELIDQIIQEIESMKVDILNKIKKSNNQLAGIKTYQKNI